MEQLIVASHNMGKIREIKKIVSTLNFQVISLYETGNIPKITEDQDTFEKNAIKKARIIENIFKKPVLADDSGLMVDVLNGAPGVYSARFGGPGLTDQQRYEKLLKEMEPYPKAERHAKFVCSIAFINSDKKLEIFNGELIGTIAKKPLGKNGFGYDPIFIPIGYDKTMAELSDETKNIISHRAKALKKFMQYILKNRNNT
jgi:XTP/dITP diphosphohydrolase